MSTNRFAAQSARRAPLVLVLIALWTVETEVPRRACAQTHGELGVMAVPRWLPLPSKEPLGLDAFTAALNISDASLDLLAASDDPRDRTLAIKIASCRADLHRLLSWRAMLDDHRLGLPEHSFPPHLSEEVLERTRSVSDVISETYGFWFRVGGDGTLAGFDARFGGQVPDPNVLVNTWVARLAWLEWPLASGAPTDAALRDQIVSLDPALRWAIVAQAHKEDRYTDAQAAAVYQSLPPEVRANIENGVRMLSFDPTYSLDDAARAREDELQVHARGILELADSLPVNPPPDPDPPPDPPAP